MISVERNAKIMFTNISWANYLVVVSLLLAVYYVVVGIRFYSYEIKLLLFGFRKPRVISEPKPSLVTVSNEKANSEFRNMEFEQFNLNHSPAPTTTNPLLEIEQLTNQVQAAIAEATGELFTKEAFLQLLREILKMHPALKDSSFQSTIQDLIISECNKNSFIRLSTEEVMQLWKEVYR